MGRPVIYAKGRGAVSNPAGRFEQTTRVRIDEFPDLAPETHLHADQSKTILSENQSPDIPFDQSLNPYKGCEHGCSYCYARQTHAYLGHSPGKDFETEIYYKPNARSLLRRSLSRASYQPSTIALGANTDPYQPAEKKLQITRGILEELWAAKHPVSVVTKGSLIERDLDLLESLSDHHLVSVAISITTLDADLKRKMEPRAAAPKRRLKTVKRLSQSGIPVTILLAPVIPAINDHEIEDILRESAQAGAKNAGYVVLRLPYEVQEVFSDWLHEHFPDRAAHVMSLVGQMRGGRANDPRFHHRQVGEGPFSELLRKRFRLAAKRYGLNLSRGPSLRCDLFRRRTGATHQIPLL